MTHGGLELLHALEEELLHLHELGNELVLTLEEIRVDSLGSDCLSFELCLEGSDALQLGASLEEARFGTIKKNIEGLVVVLVAELELLEDNLATSLAVSIDLVEGGGALGVEALGVQGDVLGTVEGTGANVLHQSGVAAASVLLAIHTLALQGALLGDNLGANATLALQGVRHTGSGALLLVHTRSRGGGGGTGSGASRARGGVGAELGVKVAHGRSHGTTRVGGHVDGDWRVGSLRGAQSREGKGGHTSGATARSHASRGGLALSSHGESR